MNAFINISVDILRDPGADGGARESWNGQKKKVGEGKSRAKREAPGESVSPEQFLTVKPVLAPDWVQKTFVFFWPISEQQISESVSCVLTKSSTRGPFVRHIASLVHRKCKALFVENLTVNVPRSLETRRRI